MAYQSKDTQEEFATVEKGSRGEFIRVTRITPEDSGRGFGGCAKGIVAFGTGRGFTGLRFIKAP